MMRRTAAVLALILLLPGPLSGQAGTDVPSENRVSSTAGILLKGDRITGENRLHLGGWAGLLFADHLAVGGGGFTLLNDVELAGSGGGTGLNLDFGYGGMFFRYWEALSDLLTGEVGFLVGAGHAEVRSQLDRTEVGSDNFLVSEAEMGILYTLFEKLHVGFSVGYRLTAGVEDLPGVSTTDLNGFTGTLSLRLGGGRQQ
jgi:hypothetical protein